MSSLLSKVTPEMLQMVEHLKGLPSFKNTAAAEPPKQKCGCGRFILVSEMSLRKSPLTRKDFVDPVCTECAPEFKKTAVIICMRCNTAAMRINAGTHRSGMTIRAGDVLHIPACPQCVGHMATGTKGVPIIEVMIHDAKRIGKDPKTVISRWWVEFAERAGLTSPTVSAWVKDGK